MEIILMDKDDVIPYENNSRIHDEKQLNQICNSIKEFGFTNPLLIDKNNTIIAGHGRYEACKRLKINSIPCIKLDHLTDIQRKALVIADNKIALNSTWDEDMLKLEIADITEALAELENSFDLKAVGIDFNFEEEYNEVYTPDIKSGEREPIKTITFTLSNTQHHLLIDELDKVKHGDLEFKDEEEINKNINGNALAFIIERYAQCQPRI